MDSTGAYLELRLNKMILILQNKAVYDIDFSIVSLDSINPTPYNVQNLLTSNLFHVPADAESLYVDFTIDGKNLNSILDKNNSEFTVTLKISAEGKSILSLNYPQLFTQTQDIESTNHRFAYDIRNLGSLLDSIELQLGIDGLSFLPCVFSSVGHIYDYTGQGAKYIQVAKFPEKIFIPTDFTLHQNYPNPFNTVTKIAYEIPEKSYVELAVYDIKGRRVNTIVSNYKNPGYWQVMWNGKDNNGNSVPSGIYICRIFVTSKESNNKFIRSQKMVLLK
jgi:hypothetical protein